MKYWAHKLSFFMSKKTEKIKKSEEELERATKELAEILVDIALYQADKSVDTDT